MFLSTIPKQILDRMNQLKLIDAFRTLLPNLRRYSQRKRNPVKQARLDHDPFVEVLYSRVRGESIKFVTSVKKANDNEEKQLIEDTHSLENGANQINQSILQNKKNVTRRPSKSKNKWPKNMSLNAMVASRR